MTEKQDGVVRCPVCGKPAMQNDGYVWYCEPCDVEIETDIEVED
jgi:ribosomal protein L37AE/L43A